MTSWPTSTTPTLPTAPPKPSTDASNTYAASPKDSSTTETTAYAASSTPADSNTSYTLKREEPTNSIEPLNYQLRKVSKNRGHFPSDEAVIKLLWLAICDIEDKRAQERDKEKGLPASKRRDKGKLVEGQITADWNKALAQLTTAYPDRINPYL